MAGFSGFLAAIFEESAEQFGGFGFEDAFIDGNTMVEVVVGGYVVEAACVTGLGIRGSVDEAIDAGGVGGAGAHGAGFEGRVEGAARQAPAARGGGGAADSEEFGVGRGVSRGLALVGGDGQDLPSSRDDGPHGDLAALGCALCCFEGAPHHGQVRGAEIFGFCAHGVDDSK